MKRANRTGFGKQPSLWSRIFLLATPFRYECADLSLDEVAERIEALDRPKETFFSDKSILTFVSPLTSVQDSFPFMMATLVRGRGDWQQTTELRGILHRDHSRTIVVAEGCVQIKQVVGWLFVCAALIGGSLAAIAFSILLTFWNQNFRYLLMLFFPLMFSGVFYHLLQGFMGERAQLLAALHDSMTIPQFVNKKPKHTVFRGEGETTRIIDLQTTAPVEKRKRGGKTPP